MNGSPRTRALGVFAVLVLLVPRLPLLGALLVGREPAAFETPFDPPGFVVHAPFSPLAFAFAAVTLLAFGVWVVRLLRQRERWGPQLPRRPWPRSGTVGLLLLAVAWPLAWGALPPLAAWRGYTFTPLWVAFLLVVAALAQWRGAGSFWRRPECPWLFVLGTWFWCPFEYYNRFTENWLYHGVRDLGAVDFVVMALLPFATVLPAVVVVRDLLRTMPWIEAFAARRPLPKWVERRDVEAAAAAIAVLGLIALPLWPQGTFPMVWLSPLLLLVVGMRRARLHNSLGAAWQGDWREWVAWPLAALVCGVFWEGWNWFSTARWTYAVSWLGEPRVFEMPLLGYAGYLVFGLACALVRDLVRQVAGVHGANARRRGEADIQARG